jgi:pilus assembly protein CpaB
MAGAGAGGPASRINRRYLLLTIIFAALSAILVYAAVARGGSNTKQAESATLTGPMVVASVDIPARTQITADMLTLKDIPLDIRPATALTNVDDAVGKVTRYPINAGDDVTTGKIVSLEGTETTGSLSFVVPKGMRAISIQADQVISAGGLVLPGDYVDIMSDLKGVKADGTEVQNYVVKTILQNVQVLAVAQKVADVAAGADNGSTSGAASSSSGSSAKPNPDAATLTILTTPEQAELLFLAESNGTLRAVVRGFGDADTPALNPVFQKDLVPTAQ